MKDLRARTAENGRHVSRYGSLTVVAWTAIAVIAAFPVSISAALVAKSSASRVLPGESLRDFRVGSLALTGESKGGELLLPFVLFGVLVGVSLLVFRLVRSGRLTSISRDLLILESILALPVVVPFVLGIGGPLLEVIDSPVLLSLVLQAPPAVFVLALPKSVRDGIYAANARIMIAPALWLMASLPLATLGLVVGIRYFLTPAALPWTWWAGFAVPAVIVPAAIAARLMPRLQFQSFLVLGWAFAGIAILALPLLLPPLMELNGSSVVLPGLDPMAWRLFLISATLLILGEAFIRQRWASNRQWLTAVPSFAVAALIVPLRGGYGLPVISSDDYHFGERFSPAILWQQFEQLPYVDVILPRGLLSNVAPGIANALLNDGSAAMNSYVNLAVAFCIVGIAHILLRTIVGVVPATAMIALVAVANSYLESDLFVTTLLISALGWIVQRINAPLLGLALAASMTTAVLAYPLMGVASLAVLTGVIMLSSIGAALSRSRDLKYAGLVIMSLVTSGLVIWFSPFGPPTGLAIEYVLNNASSNAEAFGIALDLTWRRPFALGQILSLTFVLGVFASMWIVWNKRNELRTPQWSTYAGLGIAAVPAIFALGLFGRYLGRIDPGEWLYRSAAGSLIVIGVITPAVLLLSKRPYFARAAWAFITFATVISLAIAPIGRGGLLRSSLGLLEAPTYWTSSTAVEAVPRVGYGQRDETHIEFLTEVKSITSNLPFGEPVLNLSNRGALYGYMDWTNPLGYLAPYNIPSAREEQAVIDRLVVDPPRVAFIGPGPQWDGVSLTLRNPSLAKWVMDHYTPLQCGSTTWGILKSIDDSEHANLLNCPTNESALSTDDAELWAASIGAPSYLIRIPASWGSRASRGNVTMIDLEVTPEEAPADMQGFAITFPEPPSTPLTARPDLLDLWVSCPTNPNAGAPEPRRSANLGNTIATVEWGGNSTTDPTRVSTFDWGAGRFLIPLDAYPTWQRADGHLEEVLLEAPPLDCPEGWSIQAFGRLR